MTRLTPRKVLHLITHGAHLGVEIEIWKSARICQSWSKHCHPSRLWLENHKRSLAGGMLSVGRLCVVVVVVAVRVLFHLHIFFSFFFFFFLLLVVVVVVSPSSSLSLFSHQVFEGLLLKTTVQHRILINCETIRTSQHVSNQTQAQWDALGSARSLVNHKPHWNDSYVRTSHQKAPRKRWRPFLQRRCKKLAIPIMTHRVPFQEAFFYPLLSIVVLSSLRDATGNRR